MGTRIRGGGQGRRSIARTWRGGCRRAAWRAPGTSRWWGAPRRTSCSSRRATAGTCTRASRRTASPRTPSPAATPASTAEPWGYTPAGDAGPAAGDKAGSLQCGEIARGREEPRVDSLGWGWGFTSCSWEQIGGGEAIGQDGGAGSFLAWTGEEPKRSMPIMRLDRFV